MLFEILFIIVVLLSNIVQTMTGFAGTVLAMPFAIRLVGSNVAVPVLNMAAIFICLYIAIRWHKDIAWKELLKMLLFVGAGFGAGFALKMLPHDADLFLKIYGLSITLIAVVFLFFDIEHSKIPSWVLYLALFFGGVLHQLYVSGGPLVVIYATLRLRDKHKFRATLSVMWVILNSIMVGEHAAQGLLTTQVWILVAIAAGVSIVSAFIGKKLVHHVPHDIFMKITYILLFISGVSLLL